MKRALASMLVALMLSCATPQPVAQREPPPPVSAPKPDESFREQVPPPLQLTAGFEAPVPVERTLANGARVWVYERHQLPLVSLLLVVLAGSESEPIPQAGISGLTASLLTEGTKSRTGPQIAEQMEDLAIELWASSGAEATTIGLSTLRETLPQGLAVFADVALHPAFREADFERIRKMTLTALEQKKGLPEALAADEVALKLYGPKHPWGQPSGGTPETLKRLRPRNLSAFHKKTFTPSRALFVVVGDITADEAVASLNPLFKDWKGKSTTPVKLPSLPPLGKRTVVVIDRPGSQSQLMLAGRAELAANHPDAIAARLANMTLGGIFSSRLNQALREVKGYSYGFYSGLQLQRDYGIWIASGSVEQQFTAPALEEAMHQLDVYAREGPSADELRLAKERFMGSLPGMFETNRASASALAALFVHDNPADYFRTLPARVAAVTREDVLRVTHDHLKPAEWTLVIAGPRAGNEEALAKLGLGSLEFPSSR